MAAQTGIPSVYLEHQLSHGRAAKKTQASVIEKLRHKISQPHSWTDSIKSVRSFVAERKTQSEKTEPSGVQQCLDTLQKAMKVTSQQTLKERLDLIGRQLGLNTQIQDQKVLLITDTFQVEVLLGDGGTIANVKLFNQGDVVDCPDLRDILIKRDFTEFTEHLQGLQSIYQVTSDEKLKSKAFLALQALEKDLNQLAQFQSSISGVANYIHKCPLGIMLPRLSGKPMKLIYFVSPYDLLDKRSLTAHPLTVEAITENFLGQSVTVCIESVPAHGTANKLQTMPLMNVSKTQDGKSLPSFSAVSKINSMMLPANFVLVLPHSTPISVQLMQKITSQTGLEIHKETEEQSLCYLVLQSFSEGKCLDSTKLFVSLPDQQHIYFIDGLKNKSPDQQGVMISRIPFTHPTHVPHILNLMRQQLLFNIVLASCIRPGAKKDTMSSIVFEVTAVSLQQLTIVFEHPAFDSMVTVDIDLSDITSLKCHVSCTNSDQELCSDDAISRVFQRCMSIPIVLRWLIGKGRGHLNKLKEEAFLAAEKERLERALFLKEMQHRQAKLQPTSLPANRPPPQPPHPPPLPPPPSYPHIHHSPMHFSQGQLDVSGQTPLHPLMSEVRGNVPLLEEFRHMTESNNKHTNERLYTSIDDEQVHNPLLSTLLDEEKMSSSGSQAEMHDSPMLSRLLDDNTSVATTVIPMDCKLTPTLKRRKRRLPTDFSGPSPKHRSSDIDQSDRLGMLSNSMDLDLGPAMMDQSLQNTSNIMCSTTPTHGSPSCHHHQHHHQMLNHVAKTTCPPSNVIDLTEVNLVGESSLKKLADSVDKHFIHKDVKNEPDLSMLLNEAETPNRIPNILQNSPSGSKNENASTSLEGYLKGSGEVGRAKDFDPSDAPPSIHSSTTFSKLSSLLLNSSDTSTANFSISSHKTNSTFFSDKIGRDEILCTGVGSKTISDGSFSQDIKPNLASLRKGTLRQSSSVDIPNDKQMTPNMLDKFGIPRQHQNVKSEAASNDVKPHAAEGKVSLKLKVAPFKQQNNIKPYVKSFNSIDESDLDYSRSNSIGTFDFKSDDDDDVLLQFSSDRYVYTASPTHHQISSSKQKRLNDFVAIPQKSDKTKKKDRNSGNVTKRKREKDESKREKKRKKSEHFIQESVYRTVENDTKADFKLKIRVSKKPVTDNKSDVLSDGKVHSYEIKKRSLPSSQEKTLFIKQEDKDSEPAVNENVKEKDTGIEGSSSSKTVYNKLSSSVHKSSSKSGSSKSVQGSSSVNKTDPKLVTKATIRLKPLTMPNSGSTVNIGHSGTKTSSLNSGSKADRRSSTSAATAMAEKRSTSHHCLLERRSSLSNLSERRGATQSSSSSSQLLTSSSSTLVTTTAAITSSTVSSTNLSLSSILPNAPTISKIASMPRIPKLSSSSTNTSINRTSSLDPVQGSMPTSAGTKSNNSYTVGPAGRPNPVLSGGSRSSSNTPGTFSYNNRPTTPGVTSNRPNFNSNRPSGPSHSNPAMNSGQSASQRPSGPRAHTPSVGGGTNHKAGANPTNTHRTSGSFPSSVIKSSSSNSNSPNITQKNYSSGAKVNHISSKISNNYIGQKSSSSSSNTASAQRHASQNTPLNNSIRTSSSSSVCISPNTSGLSKSPNSGKSPNLINAGRSPSLNSASKSPNISTANRSPNMSSSNSGRSPSINSNKSPNITNSNVRPSPSPSSSSKLPSTVSHRHSSSTSKHSSLSKSPNISNTMKSHSSSSPSQRSFNSTSGSNKSSTTKSDTKTPPPPSLSSNNQQLGNGKAVSVTTTHVGSTINNKIPLSSNPTFSPNLPTTELTNTSATKSTAVDPQNTSISSSTASSSVTAPPSSPTSPLLPLSPVNSNSCDHIESNQGSKIQATDTSNSDLPEKFPSAISTSATTPSVDSVKNVTTVSACRGRKNSLSAIVDKLKHNAVGSVLDLPSVLSNCSDSANSACNKISDKSGMKSTNISLDTLNQKERISSPTPVISKATAGHKKQNHMFKENHVKAVSYDNSDRTRSNSFSHSSSKSLQLDKGDTLTNAVSCDRNKHDDVSKEVSCVSDNEFARDTTRLRDSSISDRDSCFVNNPDSNKVAIERPASLKIPLPCQSVALSSFDPPAMNSCHKTSSPQSSPFQPLQSPGFVKSSLPLLASTANISKSQKDSIEQVFKMPSINRTDNFNVDDQLSETSEMTSHSHTDKSDVYCVASDHYDINCDDKEVKNSDKEIPSSKPLSSPLSDISSPENGLIIDEESLLASKSSGKIVSSKNEQLMTVSPVDENSKRISQSSGDAAVSSPNSLDCTPSKVSPKQCWPQFAQSPGLSKSSSGASVSKDSDSPCPIDDDLMDVALGFGS